MTKFSTNSQKITKGQTARKIKRRGAPVPAVLPVQCRMKPTASAQRVPSMLHTVLCGPLTGAPHAAQEGVDEE